MIPKVAGREAFGLDPAGYDASRPDYPGWVFQILRDRCGLGKGSAVLEIGAGTGKATRALLNEGSSVIAIEPDLRLAEFLSTSNSDPALTVLVSAFEDAQLDAGTFDLGVSATAFHWLDEDVALARICSLLRPGGWWAATWNVFGDDSRPDPFHSATEKLLAGPSNPAAGERGIPFGLDRQARLAALDQAGGFECVECTMRQWSLVLNADQTVALYATYSNINVRTDRDAVLAELGRIARDSFKDCVVRNMTTSLYTARRSL